MGIGQLADLFAKDPRAAIEALMALGIITLFWALVRSWNKRLEAAQLYATDLAKMLVLKERTLDLHERTLSVLEEPRVLRMLAAVGMVKTRTARGGDDGE